MQPDWKDAFKFTTELADKKGLEMAIAGSPGWSVTGGPWVEARRCYEKIRLDRSIGRRWEKAVFGIQLPKLPRCNRKIPRM